MSLMQFAASLIDNLRYLQQAYLLPLLRQLLNERVSAGKRPDHLAVIIPNQRFVEPVLGYFKTSKLDQLTIIVPEGGEGKLKPKTSNVHMFVKGLYPTNMLNQLKTNLTLDLPNYDLLVSLEKTFGLQGIDARCIGFAQLSHKPCPFPSLTTMQLERALDEYVRCKQNYGK